MKKLLFPALALVIVATPSFAQKVTIDYAHDFDFSTVKSFTYVDTEETNSGNDLTDSRIKSDIVQRLQEGGLAQKDSGGDLYVTYHVATQDQTSFNTTTFGYGGYGAGWGAWPGWGWGGGMGTSVTTPVTYTEGTLVIDAYDAADKKMVWRGTGTVTLKSTPEKVYGQVDNILNKLGKKWNKILKGQGK